MFIVGTKVDAITILSLPDANHNVQCKCECGKVFDANEDAVARFEVPNCGCGIKVLGDLLIVGSMIQMHKHYYYECNCRRCGGTDFIEKYLIDRRQIFCCKGCSNVEAKRNRGNN